MPGVGAAKTEGAGAAPMPMPAADAAGAEGASATPMPADAVEAAKPTTRGPRTTDGGETRRLLDHAPGDRYRQPADGTTGTAGATAKTNESPSRAHARRIAAGAAVAIGTALITFALITFDIGPGLLVLGIAGGWLTGLALAGGARAGHGEGAGRNRATTAAALAGLGIALALLLDAIRAYALGGVLLPWEYAMARFGIVAPLAIVLAAVAGWLRGR